MNVSALIQCAGDLSCLIGQLVTALMIATVLFLVASGLSLIFGVMGMVNFAHGSLYMLGAYLCYSAMQAVGVFGVAAVLAGLGVGILGVVLEHFLLKRLYGGPVLYQLLFTYALILIFDDLVKGVWGYQFHSMGVPDFFIRPPLEIMGTVIPFYNVFLIFAGASIGIGMWLFLGYSSIGRLIRAAADDSEMLGALGVNVRLLYTIVFGVGSVLAALGGVLSSPLRSIYPGMGTSVIIDSFIVLVIGGLGSVGGAVAGSLILGVVKALALLGFPDLEESLPFMVMALLLVVRPHGLFGKPG